MKFSLVSVALLAGLAAAAPVATKKTLSRRAVFQPTTWNDIQISGGTAGNARQEALDALAGLPNDLSTVEKADLDFLNSVNQVCNDAESEAFNPAIEAATGEEADALQRGKIKNKVLKLTATILKLQAQEAQGQDVADKLDEEMAKLQNNIRQDEKEAGSPSTAVTFDGDIPE